MTRAAAPSRPAAPTRTRSAAPTRASAAAAATRLAARLFPLTDIVSPALPASRLLRLSLFQVSVGMAVALIVGTLNRVMIVELGVPARLVALTVALPLILAPFRAVVGFRSDHHRSALRWRRVPYLWIGTMLQFGGLAMMPFALLLLSGAGGGRAMPLPGALAAGFAFLLTGAGLHTTQTVGLALAADIARPEARPRVATVLCAALLLGVLVSALVFGALLDPFSVRRLIGVVQGAAVVTVVLNAAALWKQEGRTIAAAPSAAAPCAAPTHSFRAAARTLLAHAHGRRRLFAVGLGTMAFSLQDVLLEPYGGQVLHLPVGSTTSLTALLAAGGLAGFGAGFVLLRRELDRHRVAALGVLAGLLAFSAVILASPLQSAVLFALGTAGIGAGGALFVLGTLASAVDHVQTRETGLALGSWGAVQALAAGLAIALGGSLRDGVDALARAGAFGSGAVGPATGYQAVYALELCLLFATLVSLGPLVHDRRLAPEEQLA